MLKRILIVIATFVILFATTTWWALESGGVAIAQTRTEGGDVRETHVWYAQVDDKLWLEAGTPENPWFLDIQKTPTLTLVAEGQKLRFRAVPVTEPSGHEQIRALMREKYGVRDWWVALIFDTSQSIAVRLVEAVE